MSEDTLKDTQRIPRFASDLRIMATMIYCERRVYQDDKKAMPWSVRDAFLLYDMVDARLKEGK